MQSRVLSAIETTLNIVSGFVVSYLSWIFLVPLFWPEHRSSHSVALGITILFTITSWVRAYFWRRFFARELHQKLLKRFSK
jgi:hypothetical protein